MSPGPSTSARGTLAGASDSSDYPEAFRRLYYHLYSNSAVSRAERLVEDLALLLLSKLAAEVNGSREDFDAFLGGDGSSEALLLSHLRAAAPDLVDESAHFAIDDETVRASLHILDQVDISKAPAHVMGEAFQALIGPRLRGERGQFFTPHSLVRAMVDVIEPGLDEDVLDPACGTGGFLLDVVRYWAEHEGEPTGNLRGVDKDTGLARLAATVLRLGYGGRGEVLARNSLDPKTQAVEPETADVVLTNPPFGARIGINDPAILGNYAFGRRWREDESGWRQGDDMLDAQDPQVLFLELCVNALRPGGRLGIILPEGLFGNRKSGYIWDWLRSQGEIMALMDCPRTTFQPGTDTKTNVLFFKKAADEEARRAVPVAVAVHCGHDRRGRSKSADGRPFPDDFRSIAEDFKRSRRQRKWWGEATLSDPYYLVPRFYAPQKARDAKELALTEGAAHATLGELVDSGLLTVRKGVEVGADAYGTGDVPFVRTSDVANFEINIDPTKCVDRAIYEQYAPAQALTPGDVLMVVDGRYRIGATALLTGANVRCVVQSHFRILGTPQPDALDPYALLYALNLPSVRQGIRNLVFIQSTLGTIGRRLLRLEVPLLSGEGPWTDAVAEFRSSLAVRDESLAKLISAVGGFDVEL